MVGDLLEDFHALAAESGAGRARRLFVLQALWLGLGALLFRGFHPLEQVVRALEIQSMIEAFSPRGLIADARHAARALRKDLGLVLFATLITGLGVGATTAVFSVMNPLLLKPLPFEDPEQLIMISNKPKGGLSAITSRTSNLRDFRQYAESFESIAGYNAFFGNDTYALTGEGAPERLAGVGVTGNFLEVLGIEPILGRSFTVEEGERWDDSAILITHALWQQRFAGRRDIVGEKLTINGSPSTVIGVLPPTFDFSSVFSPSVRVDLLTIFPVNDQTDRWGNTVRMIGRLAEGATFEGASVEIETLLERLKLEDPERWGLTAHLDPLRETVSGDHKTALLLLFGAAGAVLLIVCVNLSSLLLSKGIRRRHEMFLRSALGASRERLLRLLLIESLMLSLCGAALGIALAVAITRFVAGNTAVAIPLLQSVRVDAWALLFSCGVALLAGLLVGVLPALQASGGMGAA
ncbi:MAG: ABC transporter permease, partial [Acidobacteriota bacterium]